MNKEKCINLIRNYLIASHNVTDLNNGLTNITTNIQNATSDTVVFYKLKDNSESVLKMKERMDERSPGLLVVNYPIEEMSNVLVVNADDFLTVQKMICDELFPNSQRMKLVGITGTNGKTTSVNLAMQISSILGHPAISLGTIGVYDIAGPVLEDLDSTTPSYPEIRKIIFQFQNKYEALFFEVSSHALEQDRLYDLRLDAAGITSFSQDHLDYHKSMDEYFSAKMLIETKYLKSSGDFYVPQREEKLLEQINLKNPKSKVKKTVSYQDFGIHDVPLFYKAKYNQSNLEMALCLNQSIWGKINQLDLKKIVTPKGRFSVIDLNHGMAIVDYAHTPDAIDNICSATKEAFPKHKMTIVFGCGGNRDKTKRPKMGSAASRWGDKIIITSDNPRNEDPSDIISDIVPGVAKAFEVEVDRKKAIEKAVRSMEKNEIILILGKGHEEYQEIQGVKYSFSDFDIVESLKKEIQSATK